jgi:FkbM family methyltransferase
MDILNDFDSYFDSVVPHYNDGIFSVVDFSTPRISHVNNQIGRFDLVAFPSFCEATSVTRVYLDHLQLQRGDHVVDAGAYCGLTSMLFADVVEPAGLVVALEPDRQNLACLKENLAHYGIGSNLVVVDKALWHEVGTLSFEGEGNMGSSATEILGARISGSTSRVSATTLPEIERTYMQGRIDAIKMDIEGAELSVIANGLEWFAARLPRLVIEPHFVAGRIITKELIAMLDGCGYQCTVLNQGVALPLINAVPRPRGH